MKKRQAQPNDSPRAGRKLAGRLCPLALLLIAAGCSSFRTELGRPLPTQPGTFVENQTSVQTVLQKLGPPGQVGALPDGFVFLYEHSQLREFQLGISAPLPILKYFKLIRAWNSLEQQVLVLTFDDRGLLRACAARSWDDDLGGGGAIQVIVSVVSLSDRATFRRPESTHAWGRACLLRMPVTLNLAQDLRFAGQGLQQRTAPAYAGQSTLEMVKPKKLKSKKRPKSSQLY